MLSTMELIVALKEIPLFSAVRGEGLKRISDAIRETRIASGELIFAEQDRGDEMYMIHSGKVSLFRGDAPSEKLLATLDKGAYFGEMAIIDDHPRPASARAEESSTLLVLRKRDFRVAVLDYPDIAFAMFEEFARRLRQANEQIYSPSEKHGDS